MDPADYPPDLGWESPVWTLYTRIQTQQRESGGLDYNPAIALIHARGWDLDLALELLQAIELKFIELSNDEREPEPANRH